MIEESRGLLVAELFGPTFQGEGPSAGQHAVFVRLSRCNLSCAWCDTPYTWDWSRYDPHAEAQRLPVEEIVAWVSERSSRLVVITGGEPLLQQHGLIELASRLADAGRRVEIETNGTLPPSPELVAVVEAFNVSPKLSCAGGGWATRIDEAALRAFVACGKAVFKFVVTGLGDLAEVGGLARTYDLVPIWVMPEATTTDAVLVGMRDIAEEALARGWHLSTRLHVLLWGDSRGR